MFICHRVKAGWGKEPISLFKDIRNAIWSQANVLSSPLSCLRTSFSYIQEVLGKGSPCPPMMLSPLELAVGPWPQLVLPTPPPQQNGGIKAQPIITSSTYLCSTCYTIPPSLPVQTQSDETLSMRQGSLVDQPVFHPISTNHQGPTLAASAQSHPHGHVSAIKQYNVLVWSICMFYVKTSFRARLEGYIYTASRRRECSKVSIPTLAEYWDNKAQRHLLISIR